MYIFYHRLNNHLLSGLRSIDETVRFCDYKAGDRIGHGLALGVSVNNWAKRQTVTYITASEHLDNLVWAYHYGLLAAQKVPHLETVLFLIEKRIVEWSIYVYEESISPSILFKAWSLRRNCPLACNGEWGTITETLTPDFSQPLVPCGQHYDLWQKYLNSWQFKDKMTAFDTICVMVKCESDCICLPNTKTKMDFITENELMLFSVIQDYLIHEYSDMRIIIEACPSSNIHIGRFKSYSEHPVFRWYPPDERLLEFGSEYNQFGLINGPIQVC